MKTKLTCYICGRSAGPDFALATLARETDRPFLVHVNCARQLEKQTAIIEVSRQDKDKIIRQLAAALETIDYHFDYHDCDLDELADRLKLAEKIKRALRAARPFTRKPRGKKR